MARPVASFFFPTPKVAVYPALVILFGLGTASKVAIGFIFGRLFLIVRARLLFWSAEDQR